jgi:hypothetical protein
MIDGDSGVKVSIVGGYSMGHVWGKQVHMSTCKGICDIYNQPTPSNVPSEGLNYTSAYAYHLLCYMFEQTLCS